MRRTRLAVAATLLLMFGSEAASAGSTLWVAGQAPTLSPAGEGRRQYLRLNCYSCHGMHAGGGMGPAIAGAELGDLSEVVLGGGEGGMPSFHSYVSSTDLHNITTYLGTIGSRAEPTFDDWWYSVPPH